VTTFEWELCELESDLDLDLDFDLIDLCSASSFELPELFIRPGNDPLPLLDEAFAPLIEAST
jgi:hypothetical protein